MGGMIKPKVLLDRISARRHKFVSRIKVPHWLKSKLGTYILAPLCTIAVSGTVFAHERELTLFSFHPLCMSIAFLLCMTSGLVAYRNKLLLEVFSPIMQHGNTTKNRTIHMTLQTLTGCFSALGLMFILAHKIGLEKSTIPHTFHSIVGILLLCGILVQTVVGGWKYNSLTQGVIDSRNQTKKYRWHSKAGMLMFDAVLLVVVTGLWELNGISIGGICVMSVLCMLWVNVQSQMHESRSIYAPVYDKSAESFDGEDEEKVQEMKRLVDTEED